MPEDTSKEAEKENPSAEVKEVLDKLAAKVDAFETTLKGLQEKEATPPAPKEPTPDPKEPSEMTEREQAMSKRVAELEEKLTITETREREGKLRLAVREAAEASGVRKEELPFFVESAMTAFLFDEGNQLALKASDGNALRVAKNGEMVNAPVKDYFNRIKGERPYIFEDTQKTNDKKSYPVSGDGGLKRSSMSTKEKAAYITERGQDAFLALPRE